MKSTITRYLLAFALGLLAGLALINLLGSGQPKTPIVQVEDPQQAADRIANMEKRYQSKMDSLESRNNSLQSDLSRTQSALKKSRQQNMVLEKTIHERAAINNTATDTAVLLDNCDSLATAALDLLDLYHYKDSLHEAVTGNLQDQLAIKDSIIISQHEQADSLKHTLDTTLQQQQELLSAQQKLRKEVKRQKRGKKLLSVLVFIGAGFITTKVVK